MGLISSSRTRIVIAADVLTPALSEFAAALGERGAEVTVAARWRERPGRLLAGRTTTPLQVIVLSDGGHGDAQTPGERFGAWLADHPCETAVVWTPAAARWFLPHLHDHAPELRVVVRLPRDWGSRSDRRLVEAVRQHWLAVEALRHVTAPV